MKNLLALTLLLALSACKATQMGNTFAQYLPIGLQIMAGAFREADLLAFASLLTEEVLA